MSSSTADRTPWWARAARPERPRPPWALMVRAAVGLAVPLFAGLACGQLGLGVFAALGAMHATLSDRLEPGWLRLHRIGSAVGASAAGMAVGGALRHFDAAPLLTALVLTLVGFGSGALSATGPRGSAAGMLLLVSATLGGGMAAPHPWWAAAPMLLLGAGLVLLLGLRYQLRPATDPRRLALAAVYEALGELLAALGTPDGAAARRVLTARLNQLQDLLPDRQREAARPYRPRPRPRHWHRQQESARLHRAYEAALAASEAATGLLWAWRPVPPEVAAVPTTLAHRLIRAPARSAEPGSTADSRAAVPDWSPTPPPAEPWTPPCTRRLTPWRTARSTRQPQCAPPSRRRRTRGDCGCGCAHGRPRGTGHGSRSAWRWPRR